MFSTLGEQEERALQEVLLDDPYSDQRPDDDGFWPTPPDCPCCADPRPLPDGLSPRLPPSPDIYADPAGHPFCLIPRPEWAPPLQA